MIKGKAKYCGEVNPKNPRQMCERLGKCGNSRKHIAVKHSGAGKAKIIEFTIPDQHFDEPVQLIELSRQGRLF